MVGQRLYCSSSLTKTNKLPLSSSNGLMLASSPDRLVEKGATVVLKRRVGMLREPDRQTCADDTAAPSDRSPNSLSKVCSLAERVAAAMDERSRSLSGDRLLLQAGAAGLRRDLAKRVRFNGSRAIFSK